MRSLALFLALTACVAADKRPIAETDLYAFKWTADPRISPDGSQILYTQVTVTPKHDNYQTAIWLVPAAGGPERQITAGPHDSFPRWSPDSKRMAFVRSGEKDGKPEPGQIYVMDMGGGGGLRPHGDAEVRRRSRMVAERACDCFHLDRGRQRF